MTLRDAVGVSVSVDLLAGARWECAATTPGAAATPADLDGLTMRWLPAEVPGTVAGALRTAEQWRWGLDDEEVLDGQDWWYRCMLPGPPDAEQATQLSLEGLATVADIWFGGVHVLHTDNMFLAHRLGVQARGGAELYIRFSALTPLLARRHPRPRWKSRLVRIQSLRWYRTTLLGRMPGWSRWAAPVGPWRPIRLEPLTDSPRLTESNFDVRCHGEGGRVAVRAVFTVAGLPPSRVLLRVGEQQALLVLKQTDERTYAVEGTVVLDVVQRWWPHTHGQQPRYAASLEIDGHRIDLGQLAFRTIDADTRDDGFTFVVNGQPIFARGACWGTPDAVSFATPDEQLRAALVCVRDAGMNMLRIGGYATYETAAFWEVCDELGILVWQDCMLASIDPPDDQAFAAGMLQELAQLFGGLQRHPALALVCGSSETYQQAAMYGLPSERWGSTLLDETIPALAERLLPQVPYVPSSPSGGDMPFDVDSGVAHYFGVGAYLRPLSDARLAGVRFAAECLSLGTPPEPETVNEVFGGAVAAGHDPRWKATVARDAGNPWDFEDVRDHYVRELFGVDPLEVRYADPERALDLGRAAAVHLMTTVLADWRRADSSCAGAIVLTLQDLWPGAGWGLIDALGRPKAPWYAVRRVFAPHAVLMTDEGLSGLRLHVVNDRPEQLEGILRVSVFAPTGVTSEQVETPVVVPGRWQVQLGVEGLLGGFRDLTRAYRFAPPSQDVVLVELLAADGSEVSSAVHLPSGVSRPRLPDLGLVASAVPTASGWSLTVSTELFAQYVAVDASGFRPSDSWFHLAPGRSRTIELVGDPSHRPRGTVRALNAYAPVGIEASSHA